MTTHEAGSDLRRTVRIAGEAELAEQIEGQIERRACGRIRDLHVVCSDDMISPHGPITDLSRQATGMAQQVVLDLTNGHPALANQIVVGC